MEGHSGRNRTAANIYPVENVVEKERVTSCRQERTHLLRSCCLIRSYIDSAQLSSTPSNSTQKNPPLLLATLHRQTDMSVPAYHIPKSPLKRKAQQNREATLSSLSFPPFLLPLQDILSAQQAKQEEATGGETSSTRKQKGGNSTSQKEEEKEEEGKGQRQEAHIQINRPQTRHQLQLHFPLPSPSPSLSPCRATSAEPRRHPPLLPALFHRLQNLVR